MYPTHTLDPKQILQARSTREVLQPYSERRFCSSTLCFTDEIIARRISKAAVWLLTDETDDRSWLFMGKEPICPHCGAPLLS